MPPKAFQVFEDAIKAVRPYPQTKLRSTAGQAKKRIPLQEAPNRINEGKKRGSKKQGGKLKYQPVVNKISRKDEYSLENLRAIFEDEEKAEGRLEFKATSTPFDSQLANSQIVQDEQINNQRQLDLEINKIHDSINKDSIMLLIEELSPKKNRRNKSTPNYSRNKGQKKQSKPKKSNQNTDTEKKPKMTKSNTRNAPEHDAKSKKLSKKEESAKQPKREPQLNKGEQVRENLKQKLESQNSRAESKRRTRLDSRAKGNLHQTLKVPTKPKTKVKPKVAIKGTRSSKVRFRNELTYKQLLSKCAKGKDPIDLLV